ncbi:hypothetical protein G6F64_005962 [Rhizopus arrhizus]|uniref:Chromosome segregation protein Spc25 C-terminal domain-containing protein n=1 Tax=Rhizopus oryzae TaxID=64495 RepID=A0A9P6X9N0_RHIOR|nr:hypothetical protein G6F64_005962 [Rhizopus arrhizus]
MNANAGSTIEEYEAKSNRISESIKNYFETQRQNSIEKVKTIKRYSEDSAHNEKLVLDEIEKTKLNVKEYEKKLADAKDASILERRETLKQQFEIRESQLERCKERRDQLKEMLLRKKAEMKNNMEEMEREKENASIEMQSYVLHTGLRIEPLLEDGDTDRIKFSFYRLNLVRPKETYSFVLHISETRIYSVSDCIPDIPNIQPQNATLAFTADNQLVLGGGGGAGRSGVKNKLCCYKIDTRRKDLEEDASFEFSFDEDAPMCVDVHPKEPFVVVGVNSTAEEIKQGANKNCRSFRIFEDKLQLEEAVKTLDSKQVEDYQRVVRFSYDGSLIAAGTTDGKAHVLSYPGLKPLCTSALIDNDHVLDVDINLENEKLLCVLSKELKLVNLRNKKNIGKVIQTIPCSFKNMKCEFRAFRYGRGFTKDIGFAIVNDIVKKAAYIIKYDAFTFEQLKMVKVASKPITAITLSSDGAILAFASADLSITVLDAMTLKTLTRIKEAHSFSITCIAISPDRQIIASGSADNTCRITTIPIQFSQSVSINPLHTLLLAIVVACMLLWLTTLVDIEPYLRPKTIIQETNIASDVMKTVEKEVIEQPTIVHSDL